MGDDIKVVEVRVPITELPTLVEQKSKQTDIDDRLEPMSLPINDLSYFLLFTFTCTSANNHVENFNGMYRRLNSF